MAPSQLRCDRHQPESVEERLERHRRDVGRDLQVGRVVSAATGSGEERSLQVEAERPGAVGGGVRRPVANGIPRRSTSAESGAVTAVGRNDVTPVSEQAAGHPRRARRDHPSRRGRPSRGRGCRRSRGLMNGASGALARGPSSMAAIRSASIVTVPSSTRSSRTGRPTTVVGPRSVIDRPRTRAVPSRQDRGQGPRRRTGRRVRSGPLHSAIRSPRSAGPDHPR